MMSTFSSMIERRSDAGTEQSLTFMVNSLPIRSPIMIAREAR